MSEEIKYYKVLNEKRNHHGFQYKDGLNVLIEPFNDTNKSCCSGGFYYTTKEHIHKFYNYGCYLYEIHLPTENKDFKMIKDEDKFRSNMIILGKYYDLTKIENIMYIVSNINNDTRFFIAIASLNGKIDIIEWLWSQRTEYKFIYNSGVMLDASKNGHIKILDWFKNMIENSPPEISGQYNKSKYTTFASKAIDLALITNFV